MDAITPDNKNGVVPASFSDNEYIKDLLGILAENGKDATGLMALLNHCAGMENFCKQAESKLTDMKSQLDEMKEVQDHPIKHALQNAIKALEAKLAELRGQIDDLRANIIDGCKNAVAAFKDYGILALDKLASFFNIKGCMEKIQNGATRIQNDCDKALVKIENFSAEYHKAGRGLKNMARIMVGKPPIDTVKESGKLANAVGGPYRQQKKCMAMLHSAASAVLAALGKLSVRAEAIREEKETAKKPTLMERLEVNKQIAKENSLALVTPERGIKPSEIAV